MTDRVALLVVHGVADQKPLDTARAVIDLLVAAAPDGTSYTARAAETIRLPVDPLDPRNAPPAGHTATPLAKDRPTVKAIAQSLRSDFQRADWSAPDTPTEMLQSMARQHSAAPTAPTPSAPMAAAPVQQPDRGIQISNFLLSKHLSNGGRREAHATERVRVDRSDADGEVQIDVYEVYWADLSRLSSALPRIVAEAFTLMFRLSKLARSTVDEARRAMLLRRAAERRIPAWNAQAWRACAALQIGLDWVFVNGFAMLMQQLGLLGLVLLGLGALQRLVPPAQLPLVHAGAAAAIGVAALGFVAYRWRDSGWPARALPLALVAVSLWLLLVRPGWIAWASVLLILAVATAIGEAGLRIADERFPFVRPVGRAMWALLCVLLVASVAQQVRHGAAVGDLEAWSRASLFGVEVTLLATKWAWIGAGVLLFAWYLSGSVAGWRQDYEARASVASGRLGLGLSIGAFLATTMAIWAMLSGALGHAVETTRFAPCLFVPTASKTLAATGPTGDAPTRTLTCTAIDPCAPVLVVPAARPVQPADDACLWTSAGVERARATGDAPSTSARPYLQERYQKTTSSFALLAFVVLLLLAYLVGMFVPSILAEMKLLLHESNDAASRRAAERGTGSDSAAAEARADRDRRTRRLGRWLTAGFRHLDRATSLIVGFGVVLGLLVAASFYAPIAALAELQREVAGLSDRLLQPLVMTAAGIVAILVAFGRLLSQYLPALRGPLDIALDVDNHFREFPRTGIPRARIFSRYAALLREVAASGCDRVVIVAHSQGSVISAELLRYLCSDGHHAPGADARPRLDGLDLPPICLLTLGCPLRQLYAARFPTLYRWILCRHGRVSGPRASDIGVQRWINAFCSGDYIGRWLWSTHRDEGGRADALGHPMVDGTDPTAFGRGDAYAGFDPMPPAVQPFDSARELEVCLGLGAHTHYFEPEQHTVAWLIDRLVARA